MTLLYFKFDCLDDIIMYFYPPHGFTSCDDNILLYRKEYGSYIGNYKKTILTSRVTSALFEVL